MKTTTLLGTGLLLLFTLGGCTSDDDPLSAPPVLIDPGESVTTYDGADYSTVTNATETGTFAGVDFAVEMTGANSKSGMPAATADDWDIAFRREVIKLNGGNSSEGRDLEAMDLGAVVYDSVTADDTTGNSWTSDAVDYFISDWYDYDPQSHQLTMNGNVYSMVDAEGDNYVKFRVDSIVGAAMPPDMGTVWITYYYQDTANSTSLAGDTQTGSIPVGAVTGYFEFSTGTAVDPATPSNSTAWDISFNNYNLAMNSGPNGTGLCAGFLAYSELSDPTDIDGFTIQPADAPLFTDIPSSALTDWYDYDGATHTLNSKGNVYIIRTATGLIKLQILSYYRNVGGTRTSGYYTFQWTEL
jgi:hypothetical protein